MTEQEQKNAQSLYEAVRKIHKRGNAAEVQQTKDGFKVLEVNRRLVETVSQDKD